MEFAYKPARARPAADAAAKPAKKAEPSMLEGVLDRASDWLGLGGGSADDQAAAFPHYQEAAPGNDVENDPEAKKRARLEAVAARLEKAQRSGLLKGPDKAGIVAEMAKLSPEDAAELSKVYGERFKTDDGKSRSLHSEMTGAFDGAGKETKFVDAVLTGKKNADTLGVDVSVDYLVREADASVNTDERAMNELIRANATNPERAKRLAAAYEARTKKSLATACADVMDDAELKEANANLAGDHATANVAMIEQGDGERVSRMIEEVQEDPSRLEELARAAQAQTGKHLDALVGDRLPPAKQVALMHRMEVTQGAIDRERNEKLDLEYEQLAADPAKLAAARVKAEGLASELSTALSKHHVIGNNTDVTDLLRGIEPGEMKIVMQEYANQARTLGKFADLEVDLRGTLEGKDLKVANAVMSGDKELAAVSLVEASADGVFTNVDGWQKAMGTLDSGDPVADAASRARFHALMNKHQGTGDAYGKLAKSETSSYERDDLLARGQVDSDSRTAELAQVNLTRNAYGGKLNQISEGLEDTIGDAIGTTDGERDARRKVRRETDQTTRFSNLGGSEDAQLDALASLENDKQRELFDSLMQQRVGKSAASVLDEEMLLPSKHKDAGKLLAAGKYEDGVAMRMVADLDDFNVNDREDQASQPFEQVRLMPEQRAKIAQLPPEQQAAALAAETATARRSLLGKADQAAGGDGAYHKLLAQELSKNELAVADDRIAEGNASDLHRLEVAGEGVLGTSLGVDPGTISELLGNKTPAEMKAIARDWERAHPGKKFGDYLQSRADSPGMHRDFKILEQGNYARMSPEEQQQLAIDHPRALVQRVKDLEEAARGGAREGGVEVGNGLGNVVADLNGNTGDRLDARAARVDALLAKINANQLLTAEERQDLIDQARYMSGDQKGYSATKSQMVNTGAEAVGTVADVGVTALTGDQTMGSVAGGVTKSAVKSTFDPGRYGTNELYRDVVQTGTDATGNFIGGKYFSKNPLGSQLVSGVGGGISQGLADPRDLVDGGNFVEKAGTGVVEQTTSSVVTGAMENELGKGFLSKQLQSGVRTGITGDYSQGGGQLISDTVKSGVIDYARTRGADAHEARIKPPAEPMSTLTGSVGADPGATDASADPATIESSARTKQRAASVLEAMDPQARADAKRIVAGAKSPEEHALFERAIAAGQVEQLDRLRVAMDGVPRAELPGQFTGQGLVQLYDQSCVPTATQIALAQVDPLYAFDARNQPVDVLLAGQKNPMISSGGQQTPRTDTHGSPAYLEMTSDPVLSRALGAVDPLAAKGTPGGIEATKMKTQPLHRALERATGSPYEVLHGAQMPFKTPGDGTFQKVPHSRIAPALADGQPVMIGIHGHQRTMIDVDVRDGSLTYIVVDPATGRTDRITAGALDEMADAVQSVTMPARSDSETE